MSDSDFSPASVRRIEVELSKLDAAVQGISVVVNGHIELYHHQPLRRIDVQDGELLKSIVITPVFRDPEGGDVESNIAFDVSLFVVKDTTGKRLWWHKGVAKWPQIPDQYQDQLGILQKCWEDLKGISEADLKPVSI